MWKKLLDWVGDDAFRAACFLLLASALLTCFVIIVIRSIR